MKFMFDSRQIELGAFLSYLQMGVNIVIALLYTPIMIKYLGQSEYGLYNIAVSTVSILSILGFGFSNGYIRYYAKYKRDDYSAKEIYKLNGLFLIIFVFIGLLAFMCGLFLTQHLDAIFNHGLAVQEYKKAKVLVTLLTINLSISFPMSVFNIIINAHEKFAFVQLVGLMKVIVNPILAIPLLLLGYGSVALVVITLCVSFIADCISAYYVFNNLHNQFAFKNFEKGILTGLFSYVAFIALNLIIDQVNWNIDKVLLGRYKGAMEVAVYSVGTIFQTCYIMLSVAISSLFIPRIHRIVVEVNNEKERDAILSALFIRVGRFQYLILALIVTGFVFFGKAFIYNWAGVEYINSYYISLLFLLPLTVPLIQNLGIEIQRAENKHQFRSIVYLFMAVFNFILTVILCQKYGAIGAAIGTSISLIVANGLIMNVYYCKYCGIDILLFWKNIFQMSTGLILPVLCGYVIVSMIHINNICNLVICLSVYTCIYIISMWNLGLNEPEKKWIKSFVCEVLKNT